MPESPGEQQRPRARAVADAPLQSLLARGEQLARRWAVAMISARALGEAKEVPLDEIAMRAPELCEQMLRALASQQQLDRLLGLGAAPARGPAQDFPASLLACSGARDPAGAALAVEQLRGVIWEELHALCAADPRLALDLGDRLAHLSALLLAAALAAMVPAGEPSAGARAAESGGGHGARIVIFDERDSQSGEERLEQPGTRARVEEISIRDVRHVEQGPAAWIETIGSQLQRFERDGERFAVLLLELSADGAGAGALEPALRSATGVGDAVLTQEREGRYWLVVPHADRAAARTLATRIEQTLRDAAARQGLALSLATGTAVCPEDGQSASTLAAHADVGVYASRWEARGTASRRERA